MLSGSLVISSRNFYITGDKSNRKRNIGTFFCRYSSYGHLGPAPQDSANLMSGM